MFLLVDMAALTVFLVVYAGLFMGANAAVGTGTRFGARDPCLASLQVANFTIAQLP